VCLSNVKNIALAIQMYLADNNDTLPPMETNPEVIDWWAANAAYWPDEGTCYESPTFANPYLRWPVVLDEYVKNRSVWVCPSARFEINIGNINPLPNWFNAVLATGTQIFGEGWGIECPLNNGWWPRGWGGAITDSFEQGSASGDPRTFHMSLGCNAGPLPTGEGGNDLWIQWGARITKIGDPASFIICGDSGSRAALDALNLGLAAYPELCHVNCADVDGCKFGQGECCAKANMLANPDLIKPYARHFGGNNFGFLDGHAAWWASQRLIGEFAARSREGDAHPMGLFMNGPTSADLNSEFDSPGTMRNYELQDSCPPDTLTLW
jgi:prepilin-type processing-associated H-X9-DG protein